MGMNTRQVGGGTASPVANDWNNWLGEQLRGASDPNAVERQRATELSQHSNPNFANMGRQMLQRLGPAPTNPGSSPIQNLVDQFASGQVNDPSGGFAALRNLIANPQSAQNFTNPYNAPAFSGANITQLNTNFGAGQTGRADLSGAGNVGPANFNTGTGMGATAQSGFTGDLQSLIAAAANGGNINTGAGAVGFNSNVRLDPAANLDYNSPEIQAINQLATRQLGQSAADLRARFGAEGAGAMGTGAQFAEAELRAAAAPQLTMAVANVIRQQQERDLAERQARAGVNLSSDAQNLQAAIASAGNATNLQGLVGNQLQAAIQAALGARGQDFTNQAANRGLDVQQLGLGAQQAIANMNAGVTQRGQTLDSLIANQNLANNFAVNAANTNNQATQFNNTNQINLADIFNRFNLSNAGNQATFQNNTNALNLQAGDQAFRNNMNAMIAGMNQGNFGAQQQMQLLSQLFSSLQQTNALGTPQAQNVMTPSAANQFLSAGLDIGRLMMPFFGPTAAALPAGQTVNNPVMIG